VKLRLGTRGSRLALIQTEEVAAGLRAAGAEVEVVIIRTSGDEMPEASLADFGGKGLFVRRIEEAILDGRVDAGVHSLKDMPSAVPPGLCLAAFPPREDPADALVSRNGRTLTDLPAGSVVGTGSLRRSVAVRALRPDLRVAPIRGNVDTRLRKLDEGLYDAVVLAMAGLRRLDAGLDRARPLPVDAFLPAPGQGIVAVEARAADARALELLSRVDHTDTRIQAEAERAFLDRLGAGCHTPVAGLARRRGEALVLDGLVATPDGSRVLTASVTGSPADPRALGHELADELLGRGARAIVEDTAESR
jgi:hydroxymethylbilane synthase